MENTTLQDFKETLANERGFKSWNALFTASGTEYLEKRMNEAAENYTNYMAAKAWEEGYASYPNGDELSDNPYKQ